MRRPHDTSAAAWSRQMDAFRVMSGRERLRVALEMSEEVRQIALAGERHRAAARSPQRIPANAESEPRT